MGSIASPSPIPHNYHQPTVESSMLGTPGFQSTLPLGQRNPRERDEEADPDDLHSEGDFDIGDYSMDLGKLEGKSSGILHEQRRPQRPTLPSVDGGPEDFTLHLRDYINGVLPKAIESQLWEVAEGTERQSTAPARQHHPRAVKHDGREFDSEHVPSETNSKQDHHESDLDTSIPRREHKSHVQYQHTMPTISRHNTEGRLDEAADEIFDRISALQSEIERLRIESEQTRASNLSLSEQCSSVKEERSALKGQLDQVRRQISDAEARESRAHERVMILERERSKHDAGQLASVRAKYEGLISQLASTKAEAQLETEALHGRVVDLKSDLERAKDKLASGLEPELEPKSVPISTIGHKGYSQENADQERIITELRAQTRDLEASTTSSRHELDNAMSQLREVRNWASDLEEENERLSQQNARMKQDNDEMADSLDQKAVELSAAQTTMNELRERLQHASEETPSPPTSKFRELQQEAIAQADTQHDDTVQALERSHAAKIEKMKSIFLKAGRGTQKREARLTEKHAQRVLALEDEITSLRTQISDLKVKASLKPQQKIRESNTIRDEEILQLQNATDTISSLRATIAALEESMFALQDKVQAFRDEEQILAEKLSATDEDSRAVNKDSDTQMLGMIREREAKWKVKVRKLKEENDLMGRTLLMMWGREECGPGVGKKEGQSSRVKMPDKQRYIYRFEDKVRAQDM